MRDLETLAAITLALLLGAPTALAEPPADKPAPRDKAPVSAEKPGRPPMKTAPGPGPREVRQDARLRLEKQRERMAERVERRREARRDFSEKFKAKLAERRASRLERRAERREKLKKHWGEFAERRPFVAEFRIHAWRMARLHRMQMLAEELDKPQLLERVNQLIEKEEARHNARLETLKASKPGAEPAAASASPPKPPAPAAAPAPAPAPKAASAGKETDK